VKITQECAPKLVLPESIRKYMADMIREEMPTVDD
jgi:hypothetical protein